MKSHQRVETDVLVELSSPSALDPARVGTKAVNLARLLQAGFRVPPGWVLTTECYRAYGDPAGQPGAGLPPRPLPPAVRQPLEQILRATGGRPLAVRSSATAEDLPQASFAGQYDTVLNVSDLAALEHAVRACWASLRSPAALAYRDGRAVGPEMAVLVEPMVDAHAAGVAFTAHPVSGDQTQVVVNAVRGLGDRLVSGEVTPDSWVVTADEARAEALTEDAVTQEQAVEIARLARQVERVFGCPQDIEWALEGDSLFLLQARPVTGLPAGVEPASAAAAVPPGYWERDVSHSPEAAYPVDRLLPPLLERALGNWVAEFGYLFDGIEMCEIGGWTYQRLRPIGGKDGPTPPGWLLWLAVRTVPALRRRVAIARDAVRSDKPFRFIQEWYESWQPELAERIDRLRSIDLAGLSDSALEVHLDALEGLAGRGVHVHALVHGSIAPILYELVTTCERSLGWDLAACMDLLSGTSSKSTEPARKLHELALLGRADPAFPEKFAEYLRGYGHRAGGYSLATPTIAERPALLQALVEAQVERGYRPEHVDELNSERRRRSASAARAQLGSDPRSLRDFDRVLARAQAAYPAREDNEFYTLSAPFALLRYAMLEVGERLAGRDLIASRDDVIYLTIEEARAALAAGSDHRALVVRRRSERAEAVRNPGPPSYGKSAPPPRSLSFLPRDARLPMQSMLWSLEAIMALESSNLAQPGGSQIAGTAASSGQYTGPARIVRGESEFARLLPGDVLVCPITSPVWSVLFPAIGALVTDTGGVLSHPAIIAREYRIPAVVATGNATSVIADGQQVTVDGSSGTVTIGAST